MIVGEVVWCRGCVVLGRLFLGGGVGKVLFNWWCGVGYVVWSLGVCVGDSSNFINDQ